MGGTDTCHGHTASDELWVPTLGPLPATRLLSPEGLGGTVTRDPTSGTGLLPGQESAERWDDSRKWC